MTTETVENLQMSKTDSYLNTDYAKRHKIFNNYKEAPNVYKIILKVK